MQPESSVLLQADRGAGKLQQKPIVHIYVSGKALEDLTELLSNGPICRDRIQPIDYFDA